MTRFLDANGDRENVIFPVQLTMSRIGNLIRLIHTLVKVLTIHTRHNVRGSGDIDVGGSSGCTTSARMSVSSPNPWRPKIRTAAKKKMLNGTVVWIQQHHILDIVVTPQQP